MTDYRVVCVEKSASGDHHHITTVGTGSDANSAKTKWTVAKARKALDDGDKFHTESGSEKAYVEKYTCCGVNTLRTKADDTKADNLDDLRICHWKTT